VTNARTTPTSVNLLNDLMFKKQGKQAFYLLLSQKANNPSGFANLIKTEFVSKLSLTNKLENVTHGKNLV